MHNIDISRKLFEVLDLNGDDQLDVKEWFDDGGKVRPFSDMIGDHDNNCKWKILFSQFNERCSSDSLPKKCFQERDRDRDNEKERNRRERIELN